MPPKRSDQSTGPAPRFNCDNDYYRNLNLEPVGAGPLTLAAVYFQVRPPHLFPKSAPLVSRDGSSLAFIEHGVTLRVARLTERSMWRSCDINLGIFAHFGVSDGSAGSMAWASNSEFLWTAARDTARPIEDYATSPMKPARMGVDGHLDLLPPLAHAAGSLDALLWAGGDGLAVAQFGTRGTSYQPAHDDSNPTFAIVDALGGRVLDTLPFSAIEPPPSQSRFGPPQTAVKQARTAILPDGRVRLLFRALRQWIVWTQGQRPVVLPDPYGIEVPPSHLVLSPDGSRVLIGRHLRTHGWIHIRGQGTIPGEPAEGVLVALHDVETGRELWTMRATAVRDFGFPAPSISPDGRTALVGLMPTEGIPPIGLLSAQDCKILQTLPAPGGAYAMGFTRGGRAVWTNAEGLTALYEFHAGAP